MIEKGRPSTSAFTMVELLVVLATIFLLAGLFLPGLAKSRGPSQAVIDLNNIRQILKATALYAADNNDFMPHPTWGTGATGPAGWAYGTAPIPGVPSPSTFFNAANTDAQAANQLSNQVHYFKSGQLAPFLANNEKVLECPTDLAMRTKGEFRFRYLNRVVKLTAYCFTGAVSGYGSPKQIGNADLGGTYKLSEFRPTAFLMWEEDEWASFNFNDAGNNQANRSEGASQRHFRNPAVRLVSGNGPMIVGRFGGQASYINSQKFNSLRNAPAENDLLCGPGYR